MECDHPVRLKGLCAICGADLTNYAEPSVPTDQGMHILHGSLDLTVSPSEAENLNKLENDRLLLQGKLSLVVDLDQTVLHATVDNHVEGLLEDPSHPDYELVKDISRLILDDGSYTYFIKYRPGLQSFMERLHEMYELHVYTMGSRSYATEIVKKIDPDRKYFGDRIISREDSGAPDSKKQLKRIFPCDDRTVLIIDDRSDVWDYSRNLIQVAPFFFFIGTGDVNARPGMSQHVLPDVKVPTSVEYKATASHFVREPDHALEYIFSVLEQVHHVFFKEYNENPKSEPDVKSILDSLKQCILSDTALVFSGIAPKNVKIQDTHIWLLAQQYGAACDLDITERTTHIVSYQCDTSKVLCGLQRGLQVVTPEWVMQSVYKWECLSEEDFRPARLPVIRPSIIETPLVLGDLAIDEYTREIDELLAEESSSETSESESVKSTGHKRRRESIESEADSISIHFDSDDFRDELEQSFDFT